MVTVPNSATTYLANFETEYLLATTISPGGAGAIGASPTSPDGYYVSGTSVVLTAAPMTGYRFASFSGDFGGATNPQAIIMSAPHSVTANFIAISLCDVNKMGISTCRTYKRSRMKRWEWHPPSTI